WTWCNLTVPDTGPITNNPDDREIDTEELLCGKKTAECSMLLRRMWACRYIRLLKTSVPRRPRTVSFLRSPLSSVVLLLAHIF
ncbi:hypothetical protein PMAYCL1PPCAC_26424, partial [Pristionchus mayeri]